jgi:polyisoprenoid-binding protein YceI
VDTASSTAQFRARDVLRKTVVGTVPVLSGSVQVTADGEPVQVAAELDLAGVETGNARRDRDLRGHRFFHVERGATLHVTAGLARPDGEGRWVLTGELVLHTVRCPVELTAELVSLAGDRAVVRATTSLDRRDVGIDVPQLMVGRRVDVVVDAVLRAPGAT